MPMRQLRTCDFCDGEAAGVYEVVPPELSPTEAEQRRVVLCDDCLDTLETVLTPLLSRLGVEQHAGEHQPESEAAPTGGSVGSESDVDPTDSFADDDPRGTSISEGTGRMPDVGSGNESDRQASEEWEGPDDGSHAESGGQSDEPGEPPSGRPRSTTDEPAGIGGGESGDTTPGSADREGDVAPSGEETDTPVPEDGASDADEPEDFRTVMRLLGNREFPVERHELVELATSAYELEAGHVDEIIAYAVERDLLEDDGEKLYRV
ncbi:MAG: hypothetical protein ABEI27_02905 [Halobellus sp.]|uniref:hypothetical protein n=1 Tax=Halobellus sp. TaxID=1979212 RepID=UPI0035D45C20